MTYPPFWPRKPPDPEPMKTEVKKSVRLKVRRLAKLCAFAMSLPTIALASDQALQTELCTFVQADGLLHLNHRSKLSPEVMQ